MDRPDERWQYVSVQRGEHHLRMDSSRYGKRFPTGMSNPRLGTRAASRRTWCSCGVSLSLDGVWEDLTSMQTGRQERRECSGWDALRLAKP